MENKKEISIEEIKMHIAEMLEGKYEDGSEYSKEIAYYSFLKYGLSMQYKIPEDLSIEVREKIDGIIPVLTEGTLNILEDITKDGVKEDFDLWSFAMDIATEICKDNELDDGDNKIMDILVLLICTIFRMWYMDFSKEDVVAFFKGETDKDFPNMEDNAFNCKWAEEAGVSCSDIAGMFSLLNENEMTDEERDRGHEMMDGITDFFTELVPILSTCVKDWDEEFVNSHMEECKLLFLITNMLFAQVPKGIDAKKILESEERTNKAFTGYIRMMCAEPHKSEFLGDNLDKYSVVFAASYKVCCMQEEMGAGMHPGGHGAIYSEITKMKIDRLNKKNDDCSSL